MSGLGPLHGDQAEHEDIPLLFVLQSVGHEDRVGGGSAPVPEPRCLKLASHMSRHISQLFICTFK